MLHRAAREEQINTTIMCEGGSPNDESASSASLDSDDALAASNKHIASDSTSDVKRWLEPNLTTAAIFEP